MSETGPTPMLRTFSNRTIYRVFGLFLALSILGCTKDSSAPIMTQGESLAGAVRLEGAKRFPYEPMSVTSGKCALELVHGDTGEMFYVFFYPGEGGKTRLDVGDLIARDGSRRIPDEDHAPAEFLESFDLVQNRLEPLTYSDTDRFCGGLAAGTLDPGAPWLAIALAVFFLLASFGSRHRFTRFSIPLLLFGLMAALWAVSPVLLHLSAGSQEAQRLFSSALPFDLLLAGHHGDLRHPRLLFILYGSLIHFFPSIFALRLAGFGVFVLAVTVFSCLSWKRNPAASCMAAALLFHPLLLLQNTEIGPLALYSVGVLWILYRLKSERAWEKGYFLLTLFGHVFFSACNIVSYVVGTVLIFIALFASRARQDPKTWTGYIRISALVCAPFVLSVLSVVLADLPMRAASEKTPLFAWGSREWPMLAEGLFLGIFSNRYLAILFLAAGPVVVFARRSLRVSGLGAWVLAMVIPVGFLLFSGVNRVQPAYASYAVPLLFLGLGYLIGELGDVVRSLSLAVLLLLCAMQLGAIYPSLAAPSPDPKPEELVAAELLSSQEDFPQVLSLSHDLMVPIRAYLEDLSKPVEPLGDVAEPFEEVSEARFRRIPGTELRLYSLFVRHKIPSRVRALHRRALNKLRSKGGVIVLYDARLPSPEIYADLSENCGEGTPQPPFVLFRCTPN